LRGMVSPMAFCSGLGCRGNEHEPHRTGWSRSMCGREGDAERPISTVHRQDRTFQRAVVGRWWRRRQSADELAG
jgi:hypothetical protein